MDCFVSFSQRKLKKQKQLQEWLQTKEQKAMEAARKEASECKSGPAVVLYMNGSLRRTVCYALYLTMNTQHDVFFSEESHTY